MFDEGCLYQQSAPMSQVESRMDNHVVEYSPEGEFEGIGRGDEGVVESDWHAHTVADRHCGSCRG